MTRLPFGRRRRRPTTDPAVESAVESALRRSLVSHAFETPDADDLTRRILAAADDSPARAGSTPTRDLRPERTQWRTWGLPLVAAAAVVAVVGAGAAVASFDSGTAHHDQAATGGPSPSMRTVTTTVTPTASAATHAASSSGLTDVKIIDLTFVADRGYALASARCLTGPGRCTALLVTTNGTTWKATGKPAFDVAGVLAGCPADTCVDHLRFATAAVGYAFGPDALFVTKNGGESWTPQSGGAEALETLDSNVIRVGTTTAQCLPDCSYVVQTSAIGGTTWKTITLPGGTATGDGVQLSRGGGYSYLLVTRNPAGGSNDATSTLYRSSNNGSSWTDGDEPCQQSGGEVDSYAVAAGNDGDVTALCRTRDSGPFRVATSTDGGAHFTTRAGTIAYADVASTGYTDDGGALPTVLAGDPGTVLAVAGNGVWLSTDGGAQFIQSSDLVGRFASVGFESETVGRAVSADGTQIWTTRDAGKTWQESTP